MELLPVEILNHIVSFARDELSTLATLYSTGDVVLQDLVKRNLQSINLYDIPDKLAQVSDAQAEAMKRFLVELMPQIVRQSRTPKVYVTVGGGSQEMRFYNHIIDYDYVTNYIVGGGSYKVMIYGQDSRVSIFYRLVESHLFLLAEAYCVALRWFPNSEPDVLNRMYFKACARGQVEILEWLKTQGWADEQQIMNYSQNAVHYGQLEVLQWITDNYNMQGRLTNLTIWFQLAAQEFQLPVLKWHKKTFEWWHKDFVTDLQLKRLFFNITSSLRWKYWDGKQSPLPLLEWLIEAYPKFKSIIHWNSLTNEAILKHDNDVMNWIFKEAPLTFRAQLFVTNTVNWLRS